MRRFFLHRIVDALKKFFDAALAIPAHDERRDFVADREHQNRRMFREPPAVFACPLEQKLEPLRVIDLTPAWPPANIRQQVQPVLRRGIGQPIRWRGIEPHLAHPVEILANLRAGRIRLTVFVWTESAVSDTFDPKAPSSNA